MNYKIVFLDVDGTIWDEKTHKIPKSTIQAIQKLREKGIESVIVTGRPRMLIDEPAKALGITSFINSNGAYAEYQGKVIFKKTFSKSLLKEVTEFGNQRDHGISYFGSKHIYTNGKGKKVVDDVLQETRYFDYPSIHSTIWEKEVVGMCLFANEEQTKDYIEAFPHLNFNRWRPYALDMVDKHIHKATAIEEMLRHLNIKKEEAIAFGDGLNDMEMLQTVGMGIAMGNAHESLKKVAKFVTKPVLEDGIEWGLKKLNLI